VPLLRRGHRRVRLRLLAVPRVARAVQPDRADRPQPGQLARRRGRCRGPRAGHPRGSVKYQSSTRLPGRRSVGSCRTSTWSVRARRVAPAPGSRPTMHWAAVVIAQTTHRTVSNTLCQLAPLPR
jgi:hypothetical protein